MCMEGNGIRMKKEPRLWQLKDLIRSAQSNQASQDGSYYYPSRPMGYAPIPLKLKFVWGVWTGKYDVVQWPEGQ